MNENTRSQIRRLLLSGAAVKSIVDLGAQLGWTRADVDDVIFTNGWVVNSEDRIKLRRQPQPTAEPTPSANCRSWT